MNLGFIRYELRTTDVAQATTFYEAVLGLGKRDIVPLSPQAAARGAPAHWVGFVGVDETERVTHDLMQCGANIIGAPGGSKSDLPEVTLKGPGGAVIGVSGGKARVDAHQVGFVQLLTPDAIKVTADYCRIFNWRVIPAAGPQPGFVYHLIGTNQSNAVFGMVVDTKDFPGSHAHWLYYFRVSKLAESSSLVKQLGGDVVGIYPSPLGYDIAVCHDSQGAAFGLVADVS